MEAGDVKEFADNLLIQDETVRYNGHLFYFYGIRYNEDKKMYYTSVDQFGSSIHEFEKQLYYYESPDMSDCLEHLLSDNYWDGRTFWEIEGEMLWADE